MDERSAEAPASDGRAEDVPVEVAQTSGTSVPWSLSPSRASDFLACPLLYRFRAVDRLPQRPSAAAARGTLVHLVLERLFALAPAERTPTAARSLLAPAWADLVAEEPELADVLGVHDGGAAGRGDDCVATVPSTPDDGDPPADDVALRRWLRDADRLLGGYFALEDPTRLRPAATEERVSVVLGSGLELRGVVDRLDVAPTGEVRVVDYKTGRAPGPAFESAALFQMRFYALVHWRRTGMVPRLLQLMYLGDVEVLRLEPSEHDLLGFEATLEALWAAVRRALETGDFRARPGPRCRWCDHQDLCPAQGGTLPPYRGPVLLGLPSVRRGDLEVQPLAA